MKQLIIGKNVAYATAPTSFSGNITTIADGALGFYNLKDGALLTKKATDNFVIVCGRGTGKAPLVFPEVDVKTLNVQFAEYAAGAKTKYTITVPTSVTAGNHYTVIITKKGCVFNERCNWSHTVLAKSATGLDVADALRKNIKANSELSGVTVSGTGASVIIEATNYNEDFAVTAADSLAQSTVATTTAFKANFLDNAYVVDLASKCAAGKGFNYTDNAEIYPGYPEVVSGTQFDMFTLRFAVPRVSAKQRDEVVYQTVHIVLPTGATCETTLKTILGLTVATGT